MGTFEFTPMLSLGMDKKDAFPIALATLEICEALILTLVEKDIISRDDGLRLLENAASAKRSAAAEEGGPAYAKAAAIVTGLICSVEAIQKP